MNMQSAVTASQANILRAASGRVRRFAGPILVAGSALALFAPPLPPSAHAASLPPLVAQVQQAIKTAQSWKMTGNTTTSDSTGVATQMVTITAVRHGATLLVYFDTSTRHGKGAPDVTEMVIGTKHTCMRKNHQGSWNCGMPSMSSFLNQSMSLDVGNTKNLTVTAAGTRTVLGQFCVGYNFSERDTTDGLLSHGVLWLNPASKRPVEVQSSLVENIGQGQPMKSTTTLVWSNWNDPSLTIPNVGA